MTLYNEYYFDLSQMKLEKFCQRVTLVSPIIKEDK